MSSSQVQEHQAATAAQESEELLSLEDAADLLCVSKSTLYRMLERHEVKGRKVGRQWRFLKADLQAYLHRGVQAVTLSMVPAHEIDVLWHGVAAHSVQRRIAVPAYAELEQEAQIALYVRHLLLLARAVNASDLHFFPTSGEVAVRERIDGVLEDLARIPLTVYPAVVNQIKTLANLPLEERGLPLDGRIQFPDGEQLVDLRVSVIPTAIAESIAMRLLWQHELLLGMDRLGLDAADQTQFLRWLATPSGLVLVTGATGSGKTTTLYSGLLSIATAERNLMTIEDPVECLLSDVRQVGVNRRSGLTFAAALRACLRHDPDVIMVGEIRDREMAELTVQAAVTGHLVLTTLHTPSAAAGIVRLREIGIEPFLIAGTLIGALNQRLVRRICPHCAAPQHLSVEQMAGIRVFAAGSGYMLPDDAQFFRGAGCAACAGRGCRGRIALFELLEFTPAIRAAFLRGATAEELQEIAVADGMHTMIADGLHKAAEGLVALDDVLQIMSMR